MFFFLIIFIIIDWFATNVFNYMLGTVNMILYKIVDFFYKQYLSFCLLMQEEILLQLNNYSKITQPFQDKYLYIF